MASDGDYYDRLSELVSVVDEGTGWEYDFIMSLAEYEQKQRPFSIAEQNKIDELYEKLCT